jgi:tripartite-type tricarboxylate transporter receptor subunit TctC
MKMRWALLFVAAILSGTSALRSQEYPTKSVTLVVPFPAGGRTDLVARIVSQFLSASLGKSVAVVNKPGASSVLGSNEVAEATADGYTLGFFSAAAVTAQYTVPTPMSLKNYELIAIVNVDPAALAVAENAPWATLNDLVAAGRKTPGQLKIGMIPGASAQIFAAGFARAAGLDVISVPFKGDTDGAIALAGGHIELHVAVPASYKSLVESKKVRLLAIAASERSALYGNTPTFREQGVDLVIGAFHGVFAPKNTPAAVVTKLASALQATMKNPELLERMNDLGAAVYFLDGEPAKKYLVDQDDSYRAIIDALGLRVPKQ